MASEIQLACSVTATKNGASVNTSVSKALDMSGTEMISSVQTLSTSEAAISFGGCDTVKAVVLKNLDSSAEITVSLNNPATQIVSVIPPLCGILLLNAATTLYAKASAGTPDLFVVCAEG